MARSLFSGMIQCKKCDKRYKKRYDKKQPVYICQSYDNYGKEACDRNPISEQFLIEFINRRLRATTREEFEQKLYTQIDHIEIQGKYDFKVVFKDDLPMEMSMDKKKIIY